MSAWSGKSMLITGASSGIGRATALAFAREGVRIAAADIDAAGGAETVRLVRALGGEALFIPVDLLNSSDAALMVARTVAAYGSLDMAFNAAGVLAVGSITECDDATWHRVIGVNLTGVWLSMKYEVEAMCKSGGGCIVNAASAAGLVGSPNSVAYTSSKHGIIGLTRAAALDLAKSGIRVNAVCPAFVRTPMVEKVLGEISLGLDGMAAMIPMGRIGLAEEVAAAVLWLCSDGASFVTGVALPVDGGLTSA